MGNNNKDSYQLLSMCTSDSESETPEIVISPKKRRIRRKLRTRRRTDSTKISTPLGLLCCKNWGGCSISTTTRFVMITVGTGVLVFWVSTLTYLAFVLNSEIQRLDNAVQGVVAGNQGVPDALQKCHSISRELQKNQTSLFNSIKQLSQQLTNFTNQVVDIRNDVSKVKDQLKASPELINVASLSNSVASFGSQIRDLELTTKQLKENNNKVTEIANGLQQNVTFIQHKLTEIKASSLGSATSAPDSDVLLSLKDTVNSLRSNLTNVNSTLSEKLGWALEDGSSNKRGIQSLRDSNANISARVTTLRDEFNAKTTQVTSLQSSIDHYRLKIDSQLSDLKTRVSNIQDVCNKLQNNTINIEPYIIDNTKTTVSSNH